MLNIASLTLFIRITDQSLNKHIKLIVPPINNIYITIITNLFNVYTFIYTRHKDEIKKP